jgi:hypothetical protein
MFYFTSADADVMPMIDQCDVDPMHLVVVKKASSSGDVDRCNDYINPGRRLWHEHIN